MLKNRESLNVLSNKKNSLLLIKISGMFLNYYYNVNKRDILGF